MSINIVHEQTKLLVELPRIGRIRIRICSQNESEIPDPDSFTDFGAKILNTNNSFVLYFLHLLLRNLTNRHKK